MKHRTLLAALTATALAGGATAASGAESRTLTATFETPAPCIEITLDQLPENPVTRLAAPRGTARFSNPGTTFRQLFAPLDNTGDSTELFDIVNCGTGDQDLGVFVTDATVGDATWTAVAPTGNPNPCDLGPNQVYFDLFRTEADTYGWTRLSTQVTSMPWTAAAGASYGDGFRVEMAMPCEGSDGAGQTGTFDITFTALYPQS